MRWSVVETPVGHWYRSAMRGGVVIRTSPIQWCLATAQYVMSALVTSLASTGHHPRAHTAMQTMNMRIMSVMIIQISFTIQKNLII